MPDLPHHHAPHSFDHMPQIEEFLIAADFFKLMSDPSRARLFWLLCHCEECVINLSAMMQMTSPAISHHLKLLKACGLIRSRREGKEVYYRAAETPIAQALHQMVEGLVRISCPGN